MELKAENYTTEVGAVTERTPFLRWSGRNQVPSKTAPAHVMRALLYAAQTFYAFMLMLVFTLRRQSILGALLNIIVLQVAIYDI